MLCHVVFYCLVLVVSVFPTINFYNLNAVIQALVFAES